MRRGFVRRTKYLSRRGDDWFVSSTTGPADEHRLATAAIEVRIDPRAEWAQMLDEAWRINRDYFYDPAMHGVDWPAIRKKYAQFLPDLTTRADLNRLLQWMGSELSVGHHYIQALGDRLDAPARIPGGLLGADYTVANGRYRFERVYGGQSWTPELRAPLIEPGVNVRAGEYLFAVGGRDLRPPDNLYSFFENTAGRLIEISVGPNADQSGARTVQVVPIADEKALRNQAWIDGNLRKVDSLSHGRVAYVYVPNTAETGYASFKRYFYPQAHKDGIVVDERYNGGGSAADYYIDILRRAPLAYWATRQGEDLPSPAAAIAGPKALLVNETAGSGGDFFPWMFQKLGLGPVIGQRTWGGVVGILGFPILMDGGIITAPNFGAWTPEEGWIIENRGVTPDIEVEQTAAEVVACHDPNTVAVLTGSRKSEIGSRETQLDSLFPIPYSLYIDNRSPVPPRGHIAGSTFLISRISRLGSAPTGLGTPTSARSEAPFRRPRPPTVRSHAASQLGRPASFRRELFHHGAILK